MVKIIYGQKEPIQAQVIFRMPRKAYKAVQKKALDEDVSIQELGCRLFDRWRRGAITL